MKPVGNFQLDTNRTQAAKLRAAFEFASAGVGELALTDFLNSTIPQAGQGWTQQGASLEPPVHAALPSPHVIGGRRAIGPMGEQGSGWNTELRGDTGVRPPWAANLLTGGTNSFTWEVIFSPDTVAPTPRQDVLATFVDGFNHRPCAIYGEAGTWRIAANRFSLGGFPAFEVPFAVAVGAVTHLIANMDWGAGTATFYQDGVMLGQGALRPFAGPGEFNADLAIMNDAPHVLSSIRLYQPSLTPAEITDQFATPYGIVGDVAPSVPGPVTTGIADGVGEAVGGQVVISAATAEGIADGIGQALGGIVAVLGETAEGIADGVGEAIGAQLALLGGVTAGTADGVGEAVGGLVLIPGDVVAGVADGIGEAVGGQVVIDGGTAEGIADGVGTVVGGQLALVGPPAAGIADAVGQAVGGIVSQQGAALGIADGVGEAIGGVVAILAPETAGIADGVGEAVGGEVVFEGQVALGVADAVGEAVGGIVVIFGGTATGVADGVGEAVGGQLAEPNVALGIADAVGSAIGGRVSFLSIEDVMTQIAEEIESLPNLPGEAAGYRLARRSVDLDGTADKTFDVRLTARLGPVQTGENYIVEYELLVGIVVDPGEGNIFADQARLGLLARQVSEHLDFSVRWRHDGTVVVDQATFEVEPEQHVINVPMIAMLREGIP